MSEDVRGDGMNEDLIPLTGSVPSDAWEAFVPAEDAEEFSDVDVMFAHSGYEGDDAEYQPAIFVRRRAASAPLLEEAGSTMFDAGGNARLLRSDQGEDFISQLFSFELEDSPGLDMRLAEALLLWRIELEDGAEVVPVRDTLVSVRLYCTADQLEAVLPDFGELVSTLEPNIEVTGAASE